MHEILLVKIACKNKIKKRPTHLDALYVCINVLHFVWAMG